MSSNDYKLKYIKYKKKYNELKKIKSNVSDIINKIIIVPKEYSVLSYEQKLLFGEYELDSKTLKPISYIKNEYNNKIGGNKFESVSNSNDTLITNVNTLTNTHVNTSVIIPTSTLNTDTESDVVLTKNIISPDEYFSLSDSDKAKYSINESDYEKFPNRVVPKNYKKIMQ